MIITFSSHHKFGESEVRNFDSCHQVRHEQGSKLTIITTYPYERYMKNIVQRDQSLLLSYTNPLSIPFPHFHCSLNHYLPDPLSTYSDS